MLITLSAIVAGAAVVFFWNEIAGFLVNSFLPWIRENISSVFPVVAGLVDFINKGVVTVRRTIVEAYRWVKTNLLHCSTEYVLDEKGNAYSTTITVINDNGKVTGTETKRVISKWDMPAEALEQLTRNAQATEIDNKEVILRKTEEQAQKQAISLSHAV